MEERDRGHGGGRSVQGMSAFGAVPAPSQRTSPAPLPPPLSMPSWVSLPLVIPWCLLGWRRKPPSTSPSLLHVPPPQAGETAKQFMPPSNLTHVLWLSTVAHSRAGFKSVGPTAPNWAPCLRYVLEVREGKGHVKYA